MSGLGFVAWTVRTEEHAEVVFARNQMEARRLGAAELEYDEEYCEAERAPEFDACSGWQELREAQLAAGWWFGCAWCDCGAERVCDDEDFEPFVNGRDVYCNEWHAGAEAVRHVERRIRIWTAIEATLAKFPGVKIEHVSPDAGWTDSPNRRGIVDFRLPNDPTARLSWGVGDATIRVCEAYMAAFNEYRAALGKAAA